MQWQDVKDTSQVSKKVRKRKLRQKRRRNKCKILRKAVTQSYLSKMKLTSSQKNKLKEHSAHHSQKHMEFMKRRMRAGDSFTQAHKKAQVKVGK